MTLPPITSAISLDAFAARLPPGQARIFAALRTTLDGDYLKAPDILKLSGDPIRNGGHQAIYSIGSKLMGTRWLLDARQATLTGKTVFRLITRPDAIDPPKGYSALERRGRT